MATSNYTIFQNVGYQSISATSATSAAVSIAASPRTGQTLSTSAVSAYQPLMTPNAAIIVAELQAVRWRDDGTGAQNAVSGGMPLSVGQYLTYDGELSKLSFVSQTGTAQIHVALYRAN